jgi:hypothetical protein
MASKKGGRGPRRAVKGFRPGKEPVQLKRQRAKAELGKDANWMQRQTVEAVAGQSPQQIRKMVRRWSLALVVAAGAAVIGGGLLYRWTWIAGVAVHALAAVLLFLAYRIRKQGPGLEQMADSLR